MTIMNCLNLVVAIGNSDNRLSQQEWNEFVGEMRHTIGSRIRQIHFFGGSPNWEPWQTVAWICEIDPVEVAELMDDIAELRAKYKQDSAGVMISKMVFV